MATSVLEAAYTVLGGIRAWIMRIEDGTCEIVTSAFSLPPGDWELGQMASCRYFFEGVEQTTISCRGEQTLLSAGLTFAEEGGLFFVLGVLFEGTFRLTDRVSGILEGFRWSLQVMISSQVELRALADQLHATDVETACACCRRMKTRSHGWLHWDDHRFLSRGQATSHSLCESCAVAIYGQECMQAILSNHLAADTCHATVV
jgi:hypothetical protein